MLTVGYYACTRNTRQRSWVGPTCIDYFLQKTLHQMESIWNMEVGTQVPIRAFATEAIGRAAEHVLGGIRSFRKMLQEVGQYGASGSLRRCLTLERDALAELYPTFIHCCCVMVSLRLR